MPQQHHEDQSTDRSSRSSQERDPGALLQAATYLVAGLADLALDQLRHGTGRAQQVLGRADLGSLVEEGMRDLCARGRLATQRIAQRSPDNYLEDLAQRASTRDTATPHSDRTSENSV